MSRILVVEDDAIIAKDLESTLQRLGHSVVGIVASGCDAIRAVDEASPELVLMDIRLEGAIDGVEAAKRIGEQADVAVIYLTAHSDEATLDRAKATAPHGYLLKPFDERDLRTAIHMGLYKSMLDRRLAEREAWFSATLRSIGDGVVATDASDAVQFMNPMAERLTGWSLDEARGRPLLDVLRIDSGGEGAPTSPTAQAIAHRARVELPEGTKLVDRGGHSHVVDDSAAPILDGRGRVLGGVAVFRDVTEKKRLQARAAQSERMAALGTVTAGLAHEINNPLAVIQANLELVLDELDELGARDGAIPDELVKEIGLGVRAAFEASTHVASVVRDVHGLARGGGQEARVDVGAALDRAIRITSNQTRHVATVTLDVGPLPAVRATEAKLTQVFANLLLNAAQAIANTDSRLETSHFIRVRAQTDAHDGSAVIRIEDTGEGLTDTALDHAFEPFFTTKSDSGLGLGLYLCRTIVASFDGEMSVRNVHGGGASFEIRLPAATPDAPATPPPDERHEPAERRGRVLIIDDNAPLVTALSAGLSDAHEVTTETAPLAALAVVRDSAPFDVILCDLMMPGMTGMDFLEVLRKEDARAAERVVFMTGGALSERARQFLDSASNRVILKPFELDELRALVAGMVGVELR